MITAVTPGQGAAQFRAALAGVPALGSQLGAAFALYGEKPASGWAFYLAQGCPLAVKGRAAWLAVPHGSEAPEGDELASFLGFVGAASLHSNGPGPAGWKKSVLARMAPGPDLAERPAPEGFRLDKVPSMGEVADLIMAGQPRDAWEDFYAECCTRRNHGLARMWVARAAGDKPVSTVSAWAVWEGRAYMAMGLTTPECRGKGLAGWLIPAMARQLLEEGQAVEFLCRPALVPFYTRLGIQQTGNYFKYYTESSELDTV